MSNPMNNIMLSMLNSIRRMADIMPDDDVPDGLSESLEGAIKVINDHVNNDAFNELHISPAAVEHLRANNIIAAIKIIRNENTCDINQALAATKEWRKIHGRVFNG